MSPLYKWGKIKLLYSVSSMFDGIIVLICLIYL